MFPSWRRVDPLYVLVYTYADCVRRVAGRCLKMSHFVAPEKRSYRRPRGTKWHGLAYWGKNFPATRDLRSVRWAGKGCPDMSAFGRAEKDGARTIPGPAGRSGRCPVVV